jgi:hypothetical protein
VNTVPLLDHDAAPSAALSTTGLDPHTQLGEILQRITALQQQPIIPDNPFGQLGAVLQGFHAGTQGRPNPAFEQGLAQRRQALTGLTNAATVTGTLATLQDRATTRADAAAEREAKRKTELLKMRVDLTGTLLKDATDPNARMFALRQLRDLGVIGYDDATLATFANSGQDKTITDRLKLAVGAIEAGVDPSAVGVNTAGIDVNAIRSMTAEQRAALFGPDGRKTFLDNREKQIDVDTKRMIFDAQNRIREGRGTAADYALTKAGPKTPDNVVAEILSDYYAGRPLTPEKSRVVSDYLLNQRLKGLSGDAQLAMKAALGDADADRALARLKPGERNVTIAEIYARAGEVRAKVQADPAYRPTIAEQGALNAAEMFAEQKSAKPLPTKMAEQFGAARSIVDHLRTIRDIVDNQRGLDYVGPVAGRTGRAAEATGFGHIPARARLYHAIDGLLLEIGPDKFGSAFTDKEQEILSGFLTEINNPGPQFAIKLKAVERIMAQKYRDLVSVAQANKYRIPDEFVTMPGEQASEPSLKDRIRDMLLRGMSPDDIRRELGGQR